MKSSLSKLISILVLLSLGVFVRGEGLTHDYIQVPGLFDLRTDFSDGAHSLEELILLAKERGFDVLFLNEHDLMVLEYGIWPFRNILKKKVERPSIFKGGIENYLSKIRSISQSHPDVILIPGSESSPFYYWKGNVLRRNLTVCDYERHLIIVGLEKAEDYEGLPIINNKYGAEFRFSSDPAGFFLLLVPILFGLYMVKKRRVIRYLGVFIFVFSMTLLINKYAFKDSLFDPYQGYQGITSYQAVIDYVNSRGGLVFWNHPETTSGRGKLGPIFRDTAPHPQVLAESKDYTGFATLYGDTITVTDPGGLWDQVLIEYCEGKREKPAWGISTADFHEEGHAREKLGNFPTVFLVKKKTKEDILDAIKKGRMYAYRGDVDLPRLILEDFSVFSTPSSQKGIMGEEIKLGSYPEINILVSSLDSEEGTPLTVRLIRSGKLLNVFSGETPLKIAFQDEFFKPGRKIYYRLDVSDKRGRKLVSNPIFVLLQAL